MNGYDFDKTIYINNSTQDFFKFILKRNKRVRRMLPFLGMHFLRYGLKLISKEEFKGIFYSFLKYVPNLDEEVKAFWDTHEKGIKKWYLDMQKENDLIISASPSFLLEEIFKRLKIKNFLCSEVDTKTGKLLSPNCYGKEKVVRFNEAYKGVELDSFYSDSMSDLPMFKLAKKAYFVKENKIKEIDVHV